MAETLEVDLNGDGPHSIGVAVPAFEAGGDFDVVLRNHGASLHVHLRLDGDLARSAAVGTANHYVDDGAVRRVHVAVDESNLPVDGHLEIITGYGSETRHVPVSLAEPDEEAGVEVDERLAAPQPRGREPLLDEDDLPVVALGAVALLVAVLAALRIGDPVIWFGVAVVLAGLAVAVALLRR